MFSMFNQFFAALARLFSAAEKAATALDNIAEVSVVKSESFLDEAKLKARADKRDMAKELGLDIEVPVIAAVKAK